MQKRLTRQKKDIIDSIGSFETFFTADDLFDSVAKKNDDIGIATVYRFLNDERKNGRIHSYSCGRKTLYSRNRTNHCHFVCSVCGKTRHIDIEKIDFLKKDIPGKICHFQIDVYGVCDSCGEKVRRKSS